MSDEPARRGQGRTALNAKRPRVGSEAPWALEPHGARARLQRKEPEPEVSRDAERRRDPRRGRLADVPAAAARPARCFVRASGTRAVLRRRVAGRAGHMADARSTMPPTIHEKVTGWYLRARGRQSPPAPPAPSLPYKVDTSRPSLRTNWTRLGARFAHRAAARCRPSGGLRACGVDARGEVSYDARPPPPCPYRTKWTRRVPHPVPTLHVLSLTPY
jgi:hypothetical protein